MIKQEVAMKAVILIVSILLGVFTTLVTYQVLGLIFDPIMEWIDYKFSSLEVKLC